MSSTYCKKVTPCRVRKVEDTDIPRICCQLKKAIDRAKRKEVSVGFDLEYAMSAIIEDSGAVIVDDAYLVICIPSECWYKPVTFLVEKLVLKIGPGNFSSVIQYLTHSARSAGCSRIVVGGALAYSNAAITRLYKQYGFIQEHSPILIRSI